MPEPAADVLARLLELMALASGPGGIDIEEAADRLHADRERLLDDLALVTVREFYHPAGWTEDIRVAIEADTVRVSSGGRFDRPPALNLREALALGLALRSAAHDLPQASRSGMLDLADRLDGELAASPSEALWPAFSLDDGHDGTGLRALLEGAIADHAKTRIRYLKRGEREPGERTLRPYALVFSSGRWFLIGHCEERHANRVFRTDRILDAERTGESFDPPGDFDPAEYVDDGRVFRSDSTVPVSVRYSPRIADWIRERGPVRELESGAVLVDYSVSDPAWAVRHVLQYGPDAELVEPDDLRDMVAESLRRLLD